MRCLLKVMTVCLACLSATSVPAGETGPVERASLFRPKGLPIGVEATSPDALSIVGGGPATVEPCEAGPAWTSAVQVAANEAGAGRSCSGLALSPMASEPGPRALELSLKAAETGNLTETRVQAEAFDPSAGGVSRLLALARAGQWPDVASEIERLGVSGKPVLAPLAVEPAKPLTVDHLISGTIKPSTDPKELEKDVKTLLYWSLAPPVMPVTSMDGDWQKLFDATFDAMGGEVSPPIVEFCLQRMSTREILSLPEFVQRYHGRFHSLIVAYDFYEGIEGVPDGGRVQAGSQQVGLTLELIRRADPSARVWLGVGYNSRPHWSAWMKTQDPSRFAGIALVGSAATRVCSEPQVAKIVVGRFRQAVPDKQIALIGCWSYYYNTFLSAMDDRGIIELRSVVTRLKAAGFAFISIRED